MFQGKRFNPEDSSYSFYVPIEEAEKTIKQIERLNAKLKTAKRRPKIDLGEIEHLDINDINAVNQLLALNEDFTLNTPMGTRRSSLFLTACYFCTNPTVIEEMLNIGIELNLVDMYGYNALMSVILNQNMSDTDKYNMAQLLIDRGIGINRQNYEGQSAFAIAYETCQIAICELLIDRGAYLEN